MIDNATARSVPFFFLLVVLWANRKTSIFGASLLIYYIYIYIYIYTMLFSFFPPVMSSSANQEEVSSDVS